MSLTRHRFLAMSPAKGKPATSILHRLGLFLRFAHRSRETLNEEPNRAGERSQARVEPADASGDTARTVVCDDGVCLRVETDRIPGNRVTLVFVHGIASSLQEFSDQRVAFSRQVNLVLYDQRGHGGSGCSRGFGVTMSRLAEDLATVVDVTTQQHERVVLVTHSLGGMIALSFIARYQKLVATKIAGIALISTAATRIPEAAMSHPVAGTLVWTHLARVLLHSMAWSAPALDALKPSLSPPGRWWLRYTRFGRDRPPKDLLHAKQALWARTSAAVVASAYTSLLTFDRTEALRILSRIPVLVVTGTDDRTISAKRSRLLTTTIGTSAELLAVPDAGHTVNQTHAPIVNDALRTLIARSTQ